MTKEEAAIEEIDTDSSDDEGVMEGKTGAAGSRDTPNDDKTGDKLNRAEKKTRKAVQKMGFNPVSGITRVCVRKSKNVLFVISNPDVYLAPGSGSGEKTYVVFGEAKVEDMAAQAAARARSMGGGMGGRGGGMGMGPGGMDMAAMQRMMQKAKELGIDPSKGNVDPAKMAELLKASGMQMPAGLAGAMGGAGGPGAGGGMDKIEEGDEGEESGGEKDASAGSSSDKKDEDVADAKEPEEKDIELVVTQVGCSKEDAISALKKNKNDIVEAIMSFSG